MLNKHFSHLPPLLSMCVCCDHVPGLVSVPHASPPLLARPREAPSLPELRLCASLAHRGLRLHTGTLESTSGVCVSVCECEGVCASVPECVRVCLGRASQEPASGAHAAGQPQDGRWGHWRDGGAGEDSLLERGSGESWRGGEGRGGAGQPSGLARH